MLSSLVPIMAQNVVVDSDVQAWSKDLVALVSDEQRCKHYLDVKCGEMSVCGCLLAAVSPSFAGEASHAFIALSQAPESVAMKLTGFAYGGLVQLHDEEQLVELMLFAKKVGLDACVHACREAVSEGGSLQYPASLKMEEADAKLQREALRKFYYEGRMVDITLRAVPRNDSDDSFVIASPVEFRVHRVVLASASSYFSGLWAHKFADSNSACAAVDVDAHPEVVRLLVRGIYGEPIEADIKLLVDLIVLADKWQVTSVAIPALAQLKQHLTPQLAIECLSASSNYPDQILLAVVTAVANRPAKSVEIICPLKKKVEGIYEAEPHVRNSFPVWRQCGGDGILHRTTSGRWVVGFETSIAQQKNRMKSVAKDAPQNPCNVTGWQVSVSKVWVEAAEVKCLEVTTHLGEMLMTHTALALRILTGSMFGLPNDIISKVISWAGKPCHAGSLVESPEWLGLNVELISALCATMSKGTDLPNVMKEGVVAWSCGGQPASPDAMARINEFCDHYAQIRRREGGLAWTAPQASKLLSDLSTRWLKAHDDVALLAVEKIFTTDDGKASDLSGRKRHQEEADQEGPMATAAVQWAVSNLKRLRTSAKWPLVRAPVVAAVVRACSKNQSRRTSTKKKVTLRKTMKRSHRRTGGSKVRTDLKRLQTAASLELETAVLSWANPASISSVLKAVRHCDGQVKSRAVQALLDQVAQKVTSLEDMIGVDALCALQKTRREGEEARIFATVAHETALDSAKAAEAEAVRRAEAAEARERRLVERFQANTSAMLAFIADNSIAA